MTKPPPSPEPKREASNETLADREITLLQRAAIRLPNVACVMYELELPSVH